MAQHEIKFLLRRLREGMQPDPREVRLSEEFTGWSWSLDERESSPSSKAERRGRGSESPIESLLPGGPQRRPADHP